MAQTIKITSPASGATIKGKVTVQVAVKNVAMVNFYVDGVKVGSDSSAPFTHIVDTTTRTNGVHTLKAASGNGKASDTITVTIANPVLTAAFAFKEV